MRRGRPNLATVDARLLRSCIYSAQGWILDVENSLLGDLSFNVPTFSAVHIQVIYNGICLNLVTVVYRQAPHVGKGFPRGFIPFLLV